jgi:H+-transporting ATPase
VTFSHNSCSPNQQRSKKNEGLENFLAELQRLTLIHERDSELGDWYRFSSAKEDKEAAKKQFDERSAKKLNGQQSKGASRKPTPKPLLQPQPVQGSAKVDKEKDNSPSGSEKTAAE